MKPLRILLALLAAGLAVAHAQTYPSATHEPVTKAKATGRVTGGFKIPSGATVEVESGATLVVKSGGTITAEGGSTVNGLGGGGGVSDGDKGDVTISSSGTVYTVDNDAITTAKIQSAVLKALGGLTGAANKLPYLTGTGTADVTDLSAFMRGMLDDANAAAARVTLELVIGTNVQAWSAALDTIAANGSAYYLARGNHTGTQTLATISDAGNSASRNVGTTAGTVAAGDDSRITGAVQTTAIDTAAERSTLGFKTTTHGGLEERQDHSTMGATETFDLATANAHIGTLDANLTVTLTGFTNGKFCSMIIGLLQNGTGGWTVTWPGAVVTAPTVATTAGAITWVSLWSIDGGTTIYANSTADGLPNDAALAGSWNGDTTTSPTRNAVHDAFVAIDSDLDGKIDSIDGVSTAGLLSVNSSGVPGQGRTITGTSGRITVTNGDGQSGNPTLDLGADVVTKSSRLVSIPLTIDTIANSQNYGTFFIPAAFTVSKIVAVHVGTGLSSPSVIATIKHGTDRTSGTTIEAVTVTSSTTGTVVPSGIDDPTIPADSFVWIELSSRSGTTGNLEVYLIGTYD